MPDYDLERLGAKEFERMCQSLLKAVLKAPGTITFGEGADGAREATFEGKLEYPSSKECWDGQWIFQVKFHDIKRLGPDRPRAMLLSELESELNKISNKYTHRCDNYILLTNVRLSSTHRTGTHDKVREIAAKYKRVRHLHVWGGDEICRHLENHSDVRQSYVHLLTSGDLIAELMAERRGVRKRLAETISLFLQDCLDKDQFAQLDQAGETDPDKTTLLRRIFIDLEIRPQGELLWSNEKKCYVIVDPQSNMPREVLGQLGSTIQTAGLIEKLSVPGKKGSSEKGSLSAVRSLFSEKFPYVVLIGGPGYGKSTLTQYISQIHRMILLRRHKDFRGELPPEFIPILPRIPFRIVMKYYAHWLSEPHQFNTLEAYLAELVERGSSRKTTTDEIQNMFQGNPCLLILDGVDEIIDRSLKRKTLDRIREFLARMEQLRVNMQVLVTSRPTEYSREFDPERFLHFDLLPLSEARAAQYATNWVKAKNLPYEEELRVLETFEECQKAEHTNQLLTTPLQVTIVLLIIKDKGQPPSQREALFYKYWETILSREKAKAKDVIKSEEGLLFDLHAYIGYLLHRRTIKKNGHPLLTKEEFLREVQSFLRESDKRTSENVLAQRADQLVKEASTRFVLLVEPLPGFFGFDLRSFQEFFAAAHIAQTAKDTSQRFARLKAIARSDYWRNVALFFVGRIIRSNVGEAGNILELVCRPLDRDAYDRHLRPGAWLALDIAADGALASNRELQYNTIEYGLTVLEGALSEDQKVDLKRLASTLSSQDKDDILRPILRDKVHRLQLPYLRNALWLYSELFKEDDVFRGGLERCFASTRFTDRRFALDAVLKVPVKTSWLRKVFTAHPQLKRDFLLEFRWKCADANISCLEIVLEALSLTPKDAEELILKDYEPWFADLEDSKWSNVGDLSNLAKQVSAAFRIRDLLQIASGFQWVISFEEVRYHSPTEAEGASRLLRRLSNRLDVLLSQKDLLPSLQGLLWVVNLVIARPTSNVIHEFLVQVPRINVPHTFWYQHLGLHWPLTGHAATLIAIGESVPQALLNHLEPSKQESVVKDVMEIIQHGMQSMPKDKRSILASSLHLGDSLGIVSCLPQLKKIQVQVGLEVARLVPFAIYEIPKKRTVTELKYCLEAIERQLSDIDVFLRIDWLACGSWPMQKEILTRALSLLFRLVEKHRDAAPEHASSVIVLFLKIASHYEAAWRKAPAFIKWLSQTFADSKLGDGGFLISGFEMIAQLQSLSGISRFLKSLSPDLQRGAALIAEELALETLWWPREQRAPILEELVAHIGIDWKVALKLTKSEVSALVGRGTTILAICDIPVEQRSVRNRLLSAIKRCDAVAQHSAAQFFLRTVRLSSQEEVLIEFLLEILEASQHYSTEVLSVAMERLVTLIGSPDPAIRNEEQLGLP